MLTIFRSDGIRHCDGLTRREVLRAGALGWGGLTLPGLFRLSEAAGGEARPSFAHERRSEGDRPLSVRRTVAD